MDQSLQTLKDVLHSALTALEIQKHLSDPRQRDIRVAKRVAMIESLKTDIDKCVRECLQAPAEVARLEAKIKTLRSSIVYKKNAKAIEQLLKLQKQIGDINARQGSDTADGLRVLSALESNLDGSAVSGCAAAEVE